MISLPQVSEITVRPIWQVVVLFVLTFCLVGLCLALAAPFLPAITGAIALAVATRAPYEWLHRRIRSPALTAAVGTVLAVVLIMIPAFILAQELGRQIISAASLVQSGEAEDWLLSTIGRNPAIARLIERSANVVSLRQAAQVAGAFVATSLQALLAGSVTTMSQIVLMLFTLFFLFRDRADALRLIRSLLPFGEDQSDRLLERMTNTISATIQGSLTIAAIQGCLGGTMFRILGVPNAVFWGVAMACLATIPSLGTFMIWMPVAVFLAMTGHWIKAAVLVGWGALVIGTVDNVLYPVLVGSKLQLHAVPMLFAMLGGIYLFGISGIVLGPLILTTAIFFLRAWTPEGKGSVQPDEHGVPE